MIDAFEDVEMETETVAELDEIVDFADNVFSIRHRMTLGGVFEIKRT